MWYMSDSKIHRNKWERSERAKWLLVGRFLKFFSRMNVKCSEIDMLVYSYSVGRCLITRVTHILDDIYSGQICLKVLQMDIFKNTHDLEFRNRVD